LSISKRRRIKATGILLVASFISAHFCFWLLPRVFEPWNAQVIDQLFLIRSSIPYFLPPYDDTVVHVDLNNTTIQKLNNFYLNRSDYAQVIRNLSQMRTATQIYDVIFAARTNEKDDQSLIDATTEAANVYFGMAFMLAEGEYVNGESPPDEETAAYLEGTKWKVEVEGDASSLYKGVRPLLTFPSLASSAKGSGFLSIKADSDGVFRRVPLLVRYEDAFYPSIPFRAACDYLGVPPEKILVKPGSAIILKDVGKPSEAPRDISIPVDSHGNMRINFIGTWGSMKHYSFVDIYRASEDMEELELWEDELRGKIVVVSDVSTGSTDIGPVPTDSGFPLSGLHANVLHTILTERFLRELSTREMLLIEFLLLVVIFSLSLRSSALIFSISTAAVGIAYFVVAAFFFLHFHIIFHIMRPLFAVGFAMGFVSAFLYLKEEREREALRRIFEAYFSPAVARKLVLNPELVASSGQRKELTILFSDIKNFTHYSASLPPDQIRRILNEYFDAMVEVVFKYEGTVDKYIGDGLMVFFGDPEPQQDHALRCVRAAVEMQRKARELDRRWGRGGGIPIQIRIGINTGEVVVGNMGSGRRLSYTVLGSAVNLAQRLEVNAPVGGIMISERTHALVKDHVPTRSLGSIQVKGLTGSIPAYEVVLDVEGKEESQTDKPPIFSQKSTTG
jgi:adenylate cyclase